MNNVGIYFAIKPINVGTSNQSILDSKKNTMLLLTEDRKQNILKFKQQNNFV